MDPFRFRRRRCCVRCAALLLFLMAFATMRSFSLNDVTSSTGNEDIELRRSSASHHSPSIETSAVVEAAGERSSVLRAAEGNEPLDATTTTTMMPSSRNARMPNATPSENNGTAIAAAASAAPAISVTLTFRKRRRDRMGSRIQLPLGTWLIARSRGWNFCSPPDHMAAILGFAMCASGYDTLRMLSVGPEFVYRHQDRSDITESGVYYVGRGSDDVRALWTTIAKSEREGDRPVLDDGAAAEWRRMILGARLRPEMNEALWLREGFSNANANTNPTNASVRVAVHVRRGDIEPGKRNDVWVGDTQVIALIETAERYVRTRLRGRAANVDFDVHLFSEAYGVTNWTRYGSLVDRFHLAREGNDDVELNVRDWKHFATADVLIVGGTFSSIPAMARPDPLPFPTPDGGGVGLFPMTLSQDRGGVRRKWIPWHWDRGREAVVSKFPDGTMTAKVGVSKVGAAEASDKLGVCVDSEYVLELCFARHDRAEPTRYKR